MADLVAVRPCYHPRRFLPRDWTGTVLDILEVEGCPAEDRIWISLQLCPEAAVPFARFCSNYAADAAAYAVYTEAAAYAAYAAGRAADAYAAGQPVCAARAAADAAYAADAADAADAAAELLEELKRLVLLCY